MVKFDYLQMMALAKEILLQSKVMLPEECIEALTLREILFHIPYDAMPYSAIKNLNVAAENVGWLLRLDVDRDVIILSKSDE